MMMAMKRRRICGERHLEGKKMRTGRKGKGGEKKTDMLWKRHGLAVEGVGAGGVRTKKGAGL